MQKEQRYRNDNQPTLRENQTYSITLQIGSEDITAQFTSQYNPLYSSVRIIRKDFKQLFVDFTDDEINQIIYDNSILANEVASAEIDTTDGIPFYAKQYVRYKTELDLITSIVISASAGSSSEEKSLGQFSVSKEFSVDNLKDILEIIEKRLAPWELELEGMKATPTGAIRAGGSAYPLETRVF